MPFGNLFWSTPDDLTGMVSYCIVWYPMLYYGLCGVGLEGLGKVQYMEWFSIHGGMA